MNYSKLQRAAAAEILRRRRARCNATDYALYIDVPGKPATENEDDELYLPVETDLAQHHSLILNTMQDISTRPHGRCMIFTPPGAAKSTYASIVFPSQYLGSNEKRRLILASYGDDLAKKMGRRTRAIVKQQKYKSLFDTSLSSDSKAANEFSLTNGSEYMACGILGGVTGNRAHGIVIDDPVKGREQADSETTRQRVWDAYEDDLKTRLIPGGWVCIIQTRWHEDDLSGRILPEGWKGESGKIKCRDGNIWDVICLQARCEVENDPLGRAYGEYLWPEWFDKKHWAQFESNPRTWSALYQQLPSPLEGDFFKPGMIEIIPALPADVFRFVRGWDLAATKGGGDYTVGVRMGKLNDGRMVIADMERDQLGPEDVRRLLKNTADMDGRTTRIRLTQDPGQAGKDQIKMLTKMLSGYTVTASPATGSKETRASAYASQMNVGNVLMVKAAWNKAFKEEHRTFPNGAHDDIIDAASDAFNELNLKSPGFFGARRG